MIGDKDLERAIKRFDFHKVQRAMDAVSWKWINNSGSCAVPTVGEMIDTVTEHAKKILTDNKIVSSCSGGFKISRSKQSEWGNGEVEDEVIKIQFILDESDSEDYGEDDEDEEEKHLNDIRYNNEEEVS